MHWEGGGEGRGRGVGRKRERKRRGQGGRQAKKKRNLESSRLEHMALPVPGLVFPPP